MKTITIIVPCYNEQDVLVDTINVLCGVVDQLNQMTFETILLFVNDGSTDASLNMLHEAAKGKEFVKILSFSRNFGHQVAVTAGLNYCKTDYAAIIDADLQDSPTLIPQMLDLLLREKAEIVYGQREKRKGEGWFKLATAHCFYRILNSFSEIELPNDVGDFRVIGPNAIRQFNKFTEHGKYVRGLMSWMGFKQLPFKYVRDARKAGETKYPLRKMLRLAMTSLLYFSTKPLKVILGIGGISVLVSLMYGLYALLGKFIGYTDAVTGWTTIVILVSFFSGMQMLTIGVVGLYIGGIFEEVKGRSEYVVDESNSIM